MGKPFLEFENVTVVRDDAAALDHLDLRIDEGERVAVLGPNGAGFFGSIGIWPHHEVTEEMRDRAREALELLQLSRLADRHLTTLSSGQVRRAVIRRPPARR